MLFFQLTIPNRFALDSSYKVNYTGKEEEQGSQQSQDRDPPSLEEFGHRPFQSFSNEVHGWYDEQCHEEGKHQSPDDGE